jgi:uncharacterized protein involved in outer membrane biogenesis
MTPEKPQRAHAARGWRRRNLLWLLPLGAALIAGLAVLALPRLVASGYHRATIEGLASSLTGRDVHIRGKLSLALLPKPQFIAGDVTINSPDQETITATSLTLDIAPLALLRGEISARSITLQSPHIALPWPLPGGAAAIAPPRWLTALHAVITNGEISLGAITFTHVSADIFTGGGGAFSVSGTGDLSGYPLSLSIGFGALSAVGSTPVTLDIQIDDAAKLRAHLSGAYDSSSTLTGKLTFGAASLATLDSSLSPAVAGNADIIAAPGRLALSNLVATQADASLSGRATVNLAQNVASLQLSAQNLLVPLNLSMLRACNAAFGFLPVHLALDAANTRIAGGGRSVLVPRLRSSVDFGPQGAEITSLTADLPGNGNLWAAGNLDAAGTLQAKAIFDSPDLADFISAFGASLILPPAWQAIRLAGDIRGTLDQLAFEHLAGDFGPARITGTAVLAQQRSLTGALHFDRLDLSPFIALLRDPPNHFGTGNAIDLDFEITADRASIAGIPLAHLLLDAELSDRLAVRRLTAGVFGGVAAASFTLLPSPDQGKPGATQTGQISSARGILALPSAAPVAALLPARLQPPAGFVHAPLALTLSAAGPASGLSTSASLTLGPITVTAAPSIDLIDQTASGAFTLRHPDAIAAFKAFGWNAGLAWPGAGSIALRANLLLSPTQMEFSDFVLSMGELTANGRLLGGPGRQLNGQIDADTLALPPIPANFAVPWGELAGLQGKIALSANRVLLAGNQIVGPVIANLTLTANGLDLAVAQAGLGKGILKGDFSAQIHPATAPAAFAPPLLAAKFSLTGADASMLDPPVVFPITLPAGSIGVTGDLSASGYAPQAWLDTVSGSAGLTATSGRLGGFDLPGAASALNARHHRQTLLRSACLAGSTPFTQMSVTGSFSNGVYTLATASLQGPAGSATATGSIDLPDTGLTLNATLLPNLPTPPPLGLTIAGSWTAPQKSTDLQEALGWKSNAQGTKGN